MTFSEKITLVYTTNTYIYTTNQTIAQIRANIEFVIKQKEIINFQFNLTGVLKKDNTFQLVRRMGLVTIGRIGKPLTINGRFFENKEKQVIIEMETNPHFAFAILTCFSMLGGMLSLLYLYFTGIVIAFAIIIAVWLNSYFTHQYYKSEFEKALDLWCEDVPVIQRFEF